MMKEIVMEEHRFGDKGWHKTGTKTFYRVSRWIKVQHNYNPTKRNALWDYVRDGIGYKPYDEQFNPEDGLFLDYFKWNGRAYAIEQFMPYMNPSWSAVGYSWENEDGKLEWLSGYDADDYYHPISVQFDECCENVRVYEEA